MDERRVFMLRVDGKSEVVDKKYSSTSMYSSSRLVRRIVVVHVSYALTQSQSSPTGQVASFISPCCNHCETLTLLPVVADSISSNKFVYVDVYSRQ